MKKIYPLLIFTISSFFINAQTCPDGPNGVRWLSSGSGLFVLDWATANEAQVMLDNLVSITVSDGVATTGTYAPPNPALNFTAEPAASWRVVNGPGTSQRIRPDDGTLYANGAGNNSTMTGEVTFNLTGGGSIVCGYVSSTLPISLTQFTARSLEDVILLEWETELEIDNHYMAVERSTDGKNYTDIGMVEGAGNSTFINRYTLEDTQPENGVNYYRLRQVDFDGTAHYSDVIQASIQLEKQRDGLKVYPTLVTEGEMITVDLNELPTENLSIEVFNLNGQLIKTFQSFGAEALTISVDEMVEGTYLIKCEHLNINKTGIFIKN